MLCAFLLFIYFCLSVDSLLINLKKSCVPAQTAKGPCHTCVCEAEGIFVCQSTGCQHETLLNSNNFNKGECEPFMTYEYQDLFCTCNDEGKWMSYNCRTFFRNITLEKDNPHNSIRSNFVSGNVLKKRNIPKIKEGQRCVPGHVYKLSCNTCQCVPNNALICTKMACIEDIIQEKTKRVKNKEKQSKRQNVSKDGNRKSMKGFPKILRGECTPGRLYMYSTGCNKCLCKEDKTFVCTKKCKASSRKRITDKEILQFEARPLFDLPKLPHIGKECEPGKTYAVSCNLCYCTEQHDLQCTMKFCLSVTSLAKIQVQKLTGTSCTQDYTKLCAKCQCVSHKSVCKELESCAGDLSGKQLSSMGKELKLSLDASKDKCLPNATYKVHCNDCFCQPDGSLRCTQKTCLTHSQAKDLNERQSYLEIHGL